VVLIGRSGADEITVEEWAEWSDTIGYEVTCRIGGRVPRREGDRGVRGGAVGGSASGS